jgi:hypothetical protein
LRSVGEFHIRIQCEADGQCIYLSADFPAVTDPDPTIVYGQPLELTGVRFGVAGQYEVLVFWNNEIVGQSYLEVRIPHG